MRLRRQGPLSVRTVALAATIALGATLGVTACSTSTTAAGASGACSATPGVSQSAVKLGLLYPASGVNSRTFGPYRAGVDARLGVVNAKGGVYGRQVTYSWADDEGSAETNLVGARRLVQTDDVFAVQELSPSPEGSAIWLDQQGIPVVGTSNSLAWTQHRNMFSYLNIITSAGSVSTWGEYARLKGAKKSAVLFSQTSDGSRLVGAAVRESLQTNNIPTQMIEAEPAALDIPAIVRTIKDSGADLITGILDGDAFFRIAIAARAALPGIKILSLTGYDPAILAVGAQLTGMTVLTAYTPFEQPVPALSTFLDAMARYAPQQQPAANDIALAGWLDADLFLRGLQVAGRCPTRQSFMTNLRAVTGYDADGLLAAPVDMSTIYGHLTQCYWFMQISPDGKSFVPASSKPLCGRRLQ